MLIKEVDKYLFTIHFDSSTISILSFTLSVIDRDKGIQTEIYINIIYGMQSLEYFFPKYFSMTFPSTRIVSFQNRRAVSHCKFKITQRPCLIFLSFFFKMPFMFFLCSPPKENPVQVPALDLSVVIFRCPTPKQFPSCLQAL